MPPTTGLGAWMLRVGVTFASLVASVALLAAAATSAALDLLDDGTQLWLFGAGTVVWLVGMAWGVVANGLPASRRRHERDT